MGHYCECTCGCGRQLTVSAEYSDSHVVYFDKFNGPSTICTRCYYDCGARWISEEPPPSRPPMLPEMFPDESDIIVTED